MANPETTRRDGHSKLVWNKERQQIEPVQRRIWAAKVWWDGETLHVKPVYEDEALKDVTDD